jgi:glycosyltransferase involved in cell wall biosynthesis
MRRAAAIIAVSEHTATQCVELLGVARDRIHVVHLAADRRFRPPAGPRAVEDPYVLMVSEYGPHKGYVEAFAVADAIAEAGLPHCLRVAGRITAQTSPVISRLLSGARHPERVELLGWVDDLVPLYQQAAVLLVPSRHEGFGLPAVEAMATATPVVGFANSATTEVVGAGGVLTPDGDVTSMSAAVIGILKDTRRWDEASGAAVGRSRAFDWDRTVAEHAAVLISAARGGSSTPGSADVQAGLRRGEATGQP